MRMAAEDDEDEDDEKDEKDVDAAGLLSVTLSPPVLEFLVLLSITGVVY